MNVTNKFRELLDAMGISSINDDFVNGVHILANYYNLGKTTGETDKWP